ncbi:MAG TPA: hypothetical protein VG652_04270 [Gaiellaceae bacterium]|nr:hypothetical protein [Gaiellaceae bacterium]
MHALAVIIVAAVVILIGGLIMSTFFWAARKDGQEDLALQRRLGMHRRTRLGR